MELRSLKPTIVIPVLIVLAIATFQIFRGTGPMDLGEARRLADKQLNFGAGSVEVVAPDGELAVAPPKVIGSAQVIACPKVSGSAGSLAGRYGAGNRTSAVAAFECLFVGKSPSGRVLYFSGYVFRSADRSAAGGGGPLLNWLKSDATRALMQANGRETRRFAAKEQLDLWADLAKDDIYVPADKSHPSPVEKAMKRHRERLESN